MGVFPVTSSATGAVEPETAAPAAPQWPAETSPQTTVVVQAPTTNLPPPPVLVAPPPPRSAPVPPPPPKRGGKAFLIAGLSLFASTYVASSLAGAIVYDTTDDGHRRAFAANMMIPLAGPFMAASKSRTATGAWFTGLLGVAQATGVALTVVGAIRLNRERQYARAYALSAAPLPHGGQAGFSMRF